MADSERIKVVTLNVEWNKHLGLIGPFLDKVRPDIVMLQESFGRDSLAWKMRLGMNDFAFAPFRTGAFPDWIDRSLQLWGLSTLSRYPFERVEIFNYHTDNEPRIPQHTTLGTEDHFRRPVLITEVVKGGVPFRFGQLHFTWTPDGQADDYQRQDLEVLLKYLAKYPDLVLCGDFNAPRGREVFERISTIYHDNIPLSVETTLDQNLNKRPGLMLVVDGLFTTPHYEVEDVEVVSGISDHCAIVANITRK